MGCMGAHHLWADNDCLAQLERPPQSDSTCREVGPQPEQGRKLCTPTCPGAAAPDCCASSAPFSTQLHPVKRATRPPVTKLRHAACASAFLPLMRDSFRSLLPSVHGDADPACGEAASPALPSLGPGCCTHLAAHHSHRGRLEGAP